MVEPDERWQSRTGSRPDLSFVASTIGPIDQMAPLVDSLTEAAGDLALELVVTDQTAAQDVETMLAKEERPFRWEVTTSQERGLSRGRNAAMAEITAEVVAFPDDDLKYPPGVLAHVVTRFAREPTLDGLAISLGSADDGSGALLRFPDRAVTVTPGNITTTVISCGLFLRRRLTVLAGDFDEQLGAGSGTQWGAGEETDYALRCLAMGARIEFDPTVWAVHVDKPMPVADARAKNRRYGEGIGHVLRRHRVSAAHVGYLAFRRAAKVLLLIATGRLAESKAAAAWAVGLVSGYGRRPTSVAVEPGGR